MLTRQGVAKLFSKLSKRGTEGSNPVRSAPASLGRRPQSVEQDPEQAVDREQPGPIRPLAAKNVQLVTDREVL
jgi:hypothetical protein